MTCKTSYELYHQFPKLAEESGFTFNPHRPRVHIDWNKIRLIDVDGMIRERKFILIEKHMNDILDCVLESEFDVRILDEGVLKMFRLAQLTVEYQQFCRHYLDRSVYVLRQEISSLAQELNTAKQSLLDKENEIKKLRKKSRFAYKAPLPYGHDNIASMILKTLSTRADILPSTTNTDVHQNNKCKYCDKVFLNQLYLQSHISRRHTNLVETPEREVENVSVNDNVNNLLNKEIIELKNKLKVMEVSIAETQKINLPTTSFVNTEENLEKITEKSAITQIKLSTKDAEVSTSNDDYILNKIDEWKKEERQKYDAELNFLRNQITETLNLIKHNDSQNKTSEKDAEEIKQLQNKITQQSSEILELRKELSHSKVHAHREVSEKNKEAEAQISLWSKRAEAQSKQYEALLQKLNEVAKDAKESRALAEAERERAKQLQALLEKSLTEKTNENKKDTKTDTDINTRNMPASPKINIADTRARSKSSPNKINKLTDRETLENLHRKAQELLNIGSISSNSSDVSSVDKEKKVIRESNEKETRVKPNAKKCENTIPAAADQIDKKLDSNKKSDNMISKKLKMCTPIIKLTSPKHMVPSSPSKVIRAKITEQVNSRLISAGVDPLTSRLSRNVFQKQKMMLLQEQETKTKDFPDYEKIRHSVLAFIDENTSTTKEEKQKSKLPVNYSKNRLSTISSVISGVKSKALSLMKHKESDNPVKYSGSSVVESKSALTLIKTPPESPLKNHKNTKLARKATVNTNYSHEPKNMPRSHNNILINENHTNDISSNNSDDNSDNSNYEKQVTNSQKSTKAIENLIKSPAHRPSSAIKSLDDKNKNISVNNAHSLHLTSENNPNTNAKYKVKVKSAVYNNSSSDEIESIPISLQRSVSEQNLQNNKQTKGVLKNVTSTSSLNKKKVIFDMDAIQMKSLSASPSQSLTEKNENYELGLTNLEDEEWDISSIEYELPPKTDIKNQPKTRTSPKIAELKKTIESQLARRGEISSSNIVGGIDIFGLGATLNRAPSTGGSNTSLGSSILDESDNIPVMNNNTTNSSKINESYIPEILNTGNKNDSF